MIWQNPWAWLGLAALASPVLIHLLGRRTARAQSFPTLRFLEATRLLPVRRTRITDALLLALRVTILAMAVAALAQPLLLTPGRTQEGNRALARAIVLDTSASMLRATPAAERAVDSGRREAERLAAEATSSVIVETAAPAIALAGATAWLAAQAGRAEVVIVSDFQLGAIDSVDLAIVPRETGVALHRIAVLPADSPVEVRNRRGAIEVVARVAPAEKRTEVEWTLARTASGPAPAPAMLAGARERDRADAALFAAFASGAPAWADSNHAPAIVHPGFERRDELLRASRPLDEPWMADLLTRVRLDVLLAEAAATAELVVDDPGAEFAATFTAAARTASGQPVAVAARGVADGRDQLLFFSLVDAGSLASAALAAAIARGLSPVTRASELEPVSLPDDAIAAWQRAPLDDALASAHNSASDGRWLWLVVLLFIALESRARRARPARVENDALA